MAPMVIREEMSDRHLVGTDQDPVPSCKACSCVVLGFVSVYKAGSTQGVQEKRKDRKSRKSRSEEKVVSFSSASLFPARNREAVTQGGSRRIDNPTWRGTQGADIVKVWEVKRDGRRIQDTFT